MITYFLKNIFFILLLKVRLSILNRSETFLNLLKTVHWLEMTFPITFIEIFQQKNYPPDVF